MAGRKKKDSTIVTSEEKNKGEGKFLSETVRALAGRSGWICNNPDCQALTIGSADKNGPLETKVGEAAHIKGEKDGAARWENIGIDLIRSYDNGIWLCPSCHTMIDKNEGGEFTDDHLRKWKSDHQAMIMALLLSHNGPVPHLRQHTNEGREAQLLVESLGDQGVMYRPRQYEGDEPVWRAVEKLKLIVNETNKRIVHDLAFKRMLTDLFQNFVDFMNYTSNVGDWEWEQLVVLRGHVGAFLAVMEEDYGCKVEGKIREIIPKRKSKKK